MDQFNYFNDYLKECNSDRKGLILSIQKLLNSYEIYDITTYLTIFMKCLLAESIQRHLDLFIQGKIKIDSKIDNYKFEQIKKYLDALYLNPDKIIEKFTKERMEEIKVQLFSLIFYFNFNFNEEKIEEMINNKKINQYIYKGLIKYNLLFKNIKLTNQQILEAINLVTNFNELLNLFKYCQSNVLDLLQIINDNISKIKTLYSKALENINIKKNKNKIIPSINIEDFVSPKKEDDLNKISELIHNIENEIKKSNIELFISFSNSFLEEYIKFYKKDNYDNLNNLDLNNLIIIRNIIELIKNNDSKFGIKEDINKIIHNIGEYLCLHNKMTNIQILNFVKNDTYYNHNSPFNCLKNQKCFDIFSKLDIKKMDKDFIEEWNTINWIDKFDNKYIEFADSIFELVKSSEDFYLLFILLPVKKLKFVHAKHLIKELQKKYLQLYNPYIKEQCPYFLEDSVELLNLSDDISGNIEFFLSDQFQNKVPTYLIYKIYIAFLENHKNITKATENKVVCSLLNLNYEYDKIFLLTYLLERCPNSKNKIIQHFENYNLKEEEFFRLENSDSINLFQKLLNGDLFDSKDESLKNYITYNKNILNNLKNKIENYNIIYEEIKPFFVKKETELILKNRLLIIYLMNENKSSEKFKLISNRFYEEESIINDLELFIEDIKFFFTRRQNNYIVKAKQLIENIKKNNLNYCQNNQDIKEYLDLISDAKERNPKRNSLIYNEIYKKQKEKGIYYDYALIEKADSKLRELEPYLMCQIKDNVNEDLINIIKSLELNEVIINNEVDNLMKIFNLENMDDKNKLTNSILSLKYSEKIIKLISSLKNIFEITKVKKGIFSNLLNIIKSYLDKQQIVCTIQFSINILKSYSIDIFDENDNFNNILIKLSNYETVQILYNTTEEDYKKKRGEINDKDYEENYKFIKIFKDKDEITKMKDKELFEKIKGELSDIKR